VAFHAQHAACVVGSTLTFLLQPDDQSRPAATACHSKTDGPHTHQVWHIAIENDDANQVLICVRMQADGFVEQLRERVAALQEAFNNAQQGQCMPWACHVHACRACMWGTTSIAEQSSALLV
jgi:hypothetical protein